MRRRQGGVRPLGVCMMIAGGIVLAAKVLPSGVLWGVFGLALIAGGCCICRR